MIEVFESNEDGNWYFYGRDYQLQGPYDSEQQAEEACKRYYGKDY